MKNILNGIPFIIIIILIIVALKLMEEEVFVILGLIFGLLLILVALTFLAYVLGMAFNDTKWYPKFKEYLRNKFKRKEVK